MKKTATKATAVFMALAILFCFTVSAAAEDTYTILYSFTGERISASNHVVHVTGYQGDLPEDGILTIPATQDLALIKITYRGVDPRVFGFFDPSDTVGAKYSEQIKELVIPDGCKLIGERAFYGLKALEKVTFEGDAIIGDSAFAGCSNLKTVVFNGAKVELGASVFAGCTKLADVQFRTDVSLRTGVGAFNDTYWYTNYPTDFIIAGTTLVAYVGSDTSITFPLNITVVGNGALKGNTKLQSVTFTKNIVSLGDEAFMNCTALRDVNYSPYAAFDYVGVDVYTGTPYYNDYEGDFFCVGTRLIKYMGKDMYVEIPNTITEIASGAFLGCYTKSGDGSISYQISSIRIPASLSVFEDDCFALYIYPDGTPFVPVLCAYENTPGADYVADSGYTYEILGIPGDIDVDGAVTAADARLALRMAVKADLDYTPEQFFTADVDGDINVTSADARLILRMAVNLENYTPYDLLFKPATAFEIVQYYSNALNLAAKARAGYTRTITGKYETDITNGQYCSMDANTAIWLDGVRESDTSLVNNKRSFESDTDKAAANLDLCSLINTGAVKYSNCTLRDGKYYITIAMKDAEDIDGNTAVADIYPAVPRAHYDDILSTKSWFNARFNWLTYNLYYRDCTVTAVIDRATMYLEDIDMSVRYSFENIDGVINGWHVASFGRTTGTGIATRWDTIAYDAFVY